MPTRTFIRYNLGTWLVSSSPKTRLVDSRFLCPLLCRHMSRRLTTKQPWWFKHYVLRSKTAVLKPLYTFDKGVFGGKEDVQPVDRQPEMVRRESPSSGEEVEKT